MKYLCNLFEKKQWQNKDDKVFEFSSTREASIFLGCTMNQLYKALNLGRLLFKTIKIKYE